MLKRLLPVKLIESYLGRDMVLHILCNQPKGSLCMFLLVSVLKLHDYTHSFI